MKKRNYLLLTSALMFGITSLATNVQSVVADENIVEQAIANLEEVNSIKGTVAIVSGMAAEEFTATTSMSADMEELIDAQKYHVNAKLEMDLFDVSMEMENYGEVQDDTLITYSNEADDIWYKNIVDSWMRVSLKDIVNPNAYMAAGEEIIIGDETAVYNEQEVYVLTTSYAGALFNDVIDNTCYMVSDGLSLDIDFSEINMAVEIKIYKDSLLPAAVTITVPEESKELIVTEDGMTLDNFSYEIGIQEYNTIDNIEIPKEALNAENMYESDEVYNGDPTYVLNEDGNYVLSDYEFKVQEIIVPLDDYDITDYSSENYLCFEHGVMGEGTGWHDITYYLTEITEDFTLEDICENFSSQPEYLEDYGYSDVQFNDFQVMDVNGMEVNYASYSYPDGDTVYKQYYAYVEREDGFILELYTYEESYDGNCVTNDETVKMAFEAVGGEA